MKGDPLSTSKPVTRSHCILLEFMFRLAGGGEEQKGCNLPLGRELTKQGVSFTRNKQVSGERIVESDLKRKASPLTN